MKRFMSAPVNVDPYERLSNINILVMDGGAKAANLIKSIFSALGMNNVFVANDGRQGVQIMKEVRIHMIFTDWELKMRTGTGSNQNVPDHKIDLADLSGVKFIERIRHSAGSPNPFIPVIMMMDQAAGKDVFEARDSGVNEILLRPINANDFCARLIALIDNPRAFITASSYKGPCRRISGSGLPSGVGAERRLRDIKLIKHP